MRVCNLPISYYKKGMPNICHSNPRRKILRENGENYCSPAAVANSLIWLAKNHYRSLLPPLGKDSERIAKLKLVEKLATYMKTDEEGTYQKDVINGLRKYVRDRGFKTIVQLKGLEHSKCYHHTELDDQEWIMENTLGDSSVILEVDLKVGSPQIGYIGGHSVSVAGFDSIQQELYIHDPAPHFRTTPLTLQLREICNKRKLKFLYDAFDSSDHFFGLWRVNSNGTAQKDSDQNKLDYKGVLIVGATAFRIFRK